MRVLVIGAGIGGLTLAQGLRREGVDVVVYERDGPDGRPQGISLHLDDRGTTALRACLPPSHAEMVAATTGGPREQALTLSEVDGELAVAGARPLDGPARPGRQTHRPLLRAVLLTGLADVVRFGARFTRCERQPGGTVKVWFADGRTDTADVLVGADGIGSAVRGARLPDVRVVDTGRRMLMGATPLRVVAGTGLPGLIGDSATRVESGGRTMVLGVLRFTRPPSVARRELLPAMDSRVAAEAEDYVMWALPTEQHRLASAGSPAGLWRAAGELAAGMHPTLRLIVASGWPEVTAGLRIGTIPAMPAWPPGPVTLLGTRSTWRRASEGTWRCGTPTASATPC
ncbi:NAD(P)/FAD-dependent oxidoreductase [Amycolatopsis sp. Hca4]|uniref:FAD-dependent oxidoreductase n=1 Tax=Amycolatopsis sp. Hca4 TaxID=2742131 RepID=UPI001C378C0A|nr:NAD(P)-binding protein [Amycolatopsis sp. Hca4]